MREYNNRGGLKGKMICFDVNKVMPGDTIFFYYNGGTKKGLRCLLVENVTNVHISGKEYGQPRTFRKDKVESCSFKAYRPNTTPKNSMKFDAFTNKPMLKHLQKSCRYSISLGDLGFLLKAFGIPVEEVKFEDGYLKVY